MIEFTCRTDALFHPQMFFDAEKRVKDGNLGDNTVGNKEAMLKNCERYIEHRCRGGGNWVSYAELEEENKQLKLKVERLYERIYAQE